MKQIYGIEFFTGSNEERLPGFDAAFPCITTCAMLDERARPLVPWHWHKALELFLIESGSLEYRTSKGVVTLSAGCGGLVNANILHATTHLNRSESTLQLLHLFDAALLAGASGSRIDLKFIRPITASGLELIPLFPDQPAHVPILQSIRESFSLTPADDFYELRLREKLSAIWLQLLPLVTPEDCASRDPSSDRVKLMIAYIHEHYAEPLPVRELARAAICSERECYRAFHACLHTTPTAYLQDYRLQAACRMLLSGGESLTAIAHDCGFGSSSYLGKVFRSAFGCTPMEYRKQYAKQQGCI